MSERLPWLKITVRDLIADTQHMSAEAFGAFLRLLLWSWDQGRPVPNDDDEIARIIGMQVRAWRKIRPVVAEKFRISARGWSNKRLEEERASALKLRETNKLRATKAANIRHYSKHAPSTQQAILEACQSSQYTVEEQESPSSPPASAAPVDEEKPVAARRLNGRALHVQKLERWFEGRGWLPPEASVLSSWISACGGTAEAVETMLAFEVRGGWSPAQGLERIWARVQARKARAKKPPAGPSPSRAAALEALSGGGT
jgi:uncharacterized protein YdaU (DUF1376 family)